MEEASRLPGINQTRNTHRSVFSATNKSKSAAFFQNSRVDSCKYVKISNGTPYGVSFLPSSSSSFACKMRPSSEVKSLSRFLPLSPFQPHQLLLLCFKTGTCTLHNPTCMLEWIPNPSFLIDRLLIETDCLQRMSGNQWKTRPEFKLGVERTNTMIFSTQ